MRFSYLFFISLLFSCSQEEKQVENATIKFEDLVQVDDISNIIVWNNSGTHEVVGDNYDQLIGVIRDMTLVEDESFKLGGKSIELTIKGEKFTLLGKTKGNYIEVSSDIVTKNKGVVKEQDLVYFETNELNIDNY